MVSLNTTANYSEQATRIWQDMLSGKLSFEQGRALFLALRQQQGDDATTAARIADALVGSAKEQRQAGLASGAKWAFPSGEQQQGQQQTGLLSQHSQNVMAANDPSNLALQGENDPFAAFIRARRLPTYGGTPSQNWQREQFDPEFSNWQAMSALNPESTSPLWSNYLGGVGSGGSGGFPDVSALRRQAGGLFQQARGGDQQQFISQLGGTEQNRGVGSALSDLLQSSLLGKFATPVARRMGQWIPDLATQYQANTAGTGNQLLDFLNERLLLGGR